MDVRGRWMNNIFIERLWYSLKWGCVYLRELESGNNTRAEFGKWFHFYNWKRPHSFFEGKKQVEVNYEKNQIAGTLSRLLKNLRRHERKIILP